jgi:hypothetical protein
VNKQEIHNEDDSFLISVKKQTYSKPSNTIDQFDFDNVSYLIDINRPIQPADYITKTVDLALGQCSVMKVSAETYMDVDSDLTDDDNNDDDENKFTSDTQSKDTWKRKNKKKIHRSLSKTIINFT